MGTRPVYKLVRNDDYWGEKAKLETVKYVIIADEDTAFLEFKAGNLEYTQIPIGKIKVTQEDPKYKEWRNYQTNSGDLLLWI